MRLRGSAALQYLYPQWPSFFTAWKLRTLPARWLLHCLQEGEKKLDLGVLAVALNCACSPASYTVSVNLEATQTPTPVCPTLCCRSWGHHSLPPAVPCLE